MIDSFEAVALRPSIIRQQWLPPEVAMQEIIEFGKRFGLEQLLLACHAALPSNLTPELINLVRINFLNYRGIDCSWIAEADFLLSPLCRSVDDTLFEVEPMVREILLSELERRYGWQRMQEMATFLLQYLKASQEHREYPGVAQVQEWIAYSYLQPDKVVQELTELLAKSIVPEKEAQVSQYEKIQLATTMEIVARPLKYTARQQDYQHLIHSTRAFARILYGGKELPQLTTSAEQPALIEGTDLNTLFPPGVQQWIRSIAPASTLSTGAGTQKNELPPVEVTEAPTIGSEVERLLSLAGWVIQDYARADIRSGRGVAIRNFPIRAGTGDAEPLHFLLLFVDQQAAGVVVMVEDDQNLIGLEEALSLRRSYPLLQGEKPRRDPLPFSYETNTQGTRVRFTNYLDPVTRTRSVFAFHRPETLGLWLQQAPANVAKSRTDLLRARLRRMPELSRTGLSDVQYDAIIGLEKSLAENRPRALIQMETEGSGKTHAMISSIYRLLTFGNVQRVLYLTDIAGRAEYVYAAFQRYHIPGEETFPDPETFPSESLFPSNGTFSELYNVQFTSSAPTPDVEVQISPIQSLALKLIRESTLRQHYTELSALSEDWLAFGRKSTRRIVELLTNTQDMLIDIFDGDQLENATYLTDEQRDMIRDLLSGDLDMRKLTPEILADYVDLIGDLLFHGVSVTRRTIQYNPELPMDAFDIVVIDEYTRRIIDQPQLRSVLEYFDAFLIGLAEDVDPKVVNFFNNNVVYNQLLADVLLVTVTEFEARAVLDLCSEYKLSFIGEKTYYNLGVIGGARIFMVQSEIGSDGAGGSRFTTQEGIRALSPSAVIMVGLAFGMDKHTQHIGDILVSKQLASYDFDHIGSNPDGKPTVHIRGDRVSASIRLLDRFRSGLKTWHEPPNVQFGLILSGEKLVNNQDVSDQLRQIAREAIGGMMEGIGLYEAARRYKVEWLIVKAICDWADGYKSQDKSNLQKEAAQNAARFTIHVIQQGGLRKRHASE